jgi:hypothetical protein
MKLLRLGIPHKCYYEYLALSVGDDSLFSDGLHEEFLRNLGSGAER